MDYNQTIHLPQTDFPMRAGLPKREPEMLQAMYDKDLYHKMVGRNDGKPLFVLHDGPPYANGSIHIGTALNKILKDIIVKEKNMTGYCSPYVPGWDTHGLPIESAILKDKKVKRDELTTSEFREKCKEYALSFVDKQREQFKRLGVLGEWDDPYLTLKPAFEAKQVEIFGKMAEKGFIYKGMKPVYWCPHDQTALAEAEIEYQDDPCTTLFVKFPVRDDQGKLGRYADLVKTVREAYVRYEFHAVYRAVYNFCVVDMSNFYLDIIKDRLYCGDAHGRRSAQTALYTILDGMTRLIAPILAFTSDEIWSAMPHTADVNTESVLLNDMPGFDAALALSEEETFRWGLLISVRDAVNKALENARAAGVFKKAQDTEVTLSVAEQKDADFLSGVDLATLCIVSRVTVTTGAVEGEKMADCLIPCTIAVKLSEAPKCVRCWNHNEHVGEDHDHPELCPRCARVVRAEA